ncbi:MAG TPA: glycoside hydrolase family 27 protein [Opitutales bacterium]|nr:glycoside hydrolase family 27 protein [Opitutales bacterium]
MKKSHLRIAAGAFLAFFASMPSTACSSESDSDAPAFLTWAPTPPMGWNSWDCFATTVTEAQAKEAADVMADKLKQHGWQYVVVDIQWYRPDSSDFGYKEGAELAMDGFGRLQPAVNRFPSSGDGMGFKALADYVHGRGLKFGVHLMRGIPRLAVERNLPILGTKFHAADIADKARPCAWNPDMWGVDVKKPGAQAYYDSVFALLAEWGVDFVKVDDIARPYHDNEPEIEAVRKAIDKSGRAIVLSLSPGETALTAAEHVKNHANLWRISDDFWDSYASLYDQFARLDNWHKLGQPGAWPDADMLPLGTLAMGSRTSNFTHDEAVTVMTLWSIAKSPLMFGGDLSKLDDETLALLTNDAVLRVDQRSVKNRPIPCAAPWKMWTAEDPDSGDVYLAFFNAPMPTPKEREDSKAYGANVTIAGRARPVRRPAPSNSRASASRATRSSSTYGPTSRSRSGTTK